MTKEEAIAFVEQVDQAIQGWAPIAEDLVDFVQSEDPDEETYDHQEYVALVEVWKGLRDCTWGCRAFLAEQDEIDQ